MKGFIFTLDALLAVIVALLMITAAYTMLPRTQQDYFIESYQTKIANDILIVLDKNETLETQDKTLIQNSLTDILPNNYEARLNVYTYECNNPTCDKFILSTKVPPYEIIIGSSPEKDPVLGKRSFLTFEDDRVNYYSIAELRIWLV